MPILPDLCDGDENLENVVRWTAEHGGKFVLAGGLTLADQQREYFFEVMVDQFPDLLTGTRDSIHLKAMDLCAATGDPSRCESRNCVRNMAFRIGSRGQSLPATSGH